MFTSAVLTFEIPMVLFAALVAFGLRDRSDSVGPIWAVAGVMALLCLVAAALVRTPAGLWVGSGVQVLLVASGFVISSMFLMGAIFAALWVIAIVLGNRIDRERAERDAAGDRLAP